MTPGLMGRGCQEGIDIVERSDDKSSEQDVRASGEACGTWHDKEGLG